ncbi:hypothetical protein QYM36_003526 [Artemia franciscana]|uniref:Uncharacterized protein n=1 Tax=Artemia franciscana TaxID=6661 RepID=A0AA88L8Q5_ARTSF|nr:hypothetical protein QYM36_003526 [Artemia franciscana]
MSIHDAVPVEAWEKSLVKNKKPSGDIRDQRKEGSPKTNMFDIVGENRSKSIPLAVHSTKRVAAKRRSFVCSWEQYEKLKHFVVRSPHDGKTAWCKFCCKTLNGSKYNMIVHSQRESHRENVKIDGSQMPLNPLFESTYQRRQAVSLCELRFVAWFAAEDIPFNKADSLTPFLKASVPDSSILRQVKLKRTKVKGVIHDLMAPQERQTLADLLTRAHYSLIVDETTDKSSAKALVMVAKYKLHATLLVKEEFLGLVEVTDASSEGQKK